MKRFCARSRWSSHTSFLGYSAPRFYYNVNPQAPAGNYAQILVNTKSVKGTPELVASLRQQLPDAAPEAKVFVKELQQGQIMEAPVEVRIVGDDAATLRTLGDRVEDILRHTPGATYIHTDWHEDAWQVGVNVREEVANRMGLTNASIAQQLAGSFEGAPMTTFWEGDRDVDVVLRLDPAERQSFQNVADTYVMSPVTGARVPLSAVASLTPEWEPGRIVRRNGVRTLTVRAFPSGHRLASQILGRRAQANGRDGTAARLSHRIRRRVRESARRLRLRCTNALLISLVLIFLILLFQFRTLVDPLIVMAAFPLALPGAALGLLITHNTFGFTAFIGVISVGGLVVRNSIILIDYIHLRMKAGVDLGAGGAGGRRTPLAAHLPYFHGRRRGRHPDDSLRIEPVVAAGQRDCLRSAGIDVLHAGGHPGSVCCGASQARRRLEDDDDFVVSLVSKARSGALGHRRYFVPPHACELCAR